MKAAGALTIAAGLLSSTSAFAQSPFAAVGTYGSVAGYSRGPSPAAPDNVAGFYFGHFTIWPGGQPPGLPYTNSITGNQLRMETLYASADRTYSLSLVHAWDTPPANGCGCAYIPAYYVALQMAPRGQGFTAGQLVHDNFATYYFCCTYGDGNGRTMLVEWNMDNGSAAMSINGQPWVAPFIANAQGLPFNVALGSQPRYNLIDSEAVQDWPGFPWSATAFIGATASSVIVLWGNGYGAYTMTNLAGSTATYPNNYGIGGSYNQFGYPEDQIVWGP